MSENLVLIEEERQVIEISDDEEVVNNKALKINNVDGEDEGNVPIFRASHEYNGIISNVSQDAVKNSSFWICTSSSTRTENNEKQKIISEYISGESENNGLRCLRFENFQATETSGLKDEIMESITNSANSQNKKGWKKKKRIRVRNKKFVKNTFLRNSRYKQISKKYKKLSTVRKISNPTVDELATDNANTVITICNPNNSFKKYDFSVVHWLKPLRNLSSPPHLQMVIIDRGHPEWKIEHTKWLMVEKRLLEALNNEMIRTNDTSIGLFDGAKWQRGIKIVGCHNENAFNFITTFIMTLDKLWCGAKLDVFPISCVARHIVKVYIPPPTLKTELTLSLIKLQNPTIKSQDWKVIREKERPSNCGVDIWLSINDESFTEICRLRGEIKYGINRIWIKPSQ